MSRAEAQRTHATLSRQGFEKLADLRHADPRGKRMRPADRLYGRRRR